MKASKFTDAQKAFILKQGADGVPVADICRKAGISQATYFNWKKKYDGMSPPEMRRLKQLEDENAKLRKLVADLSLDREMLQDVIRLEACSQAQAGEGDDCGMGRVDPAACRGLEFIHRPTITAPAAASRPASKPGSRRSARRAVRYGYRRVHVLLLREGWRVNHKLTYRIYRNLGLQLRNKTQKRRVKAKLRADRRPATEPNETWAMDFLHDQLATGQKIRVLTVVDILSLLAGA